MNAKQVTKTMTNDELKEFCCKLKGINEKLMGIGAKISLSAVYNTPEKGMHEVTYWLDKNTE